MQDINHLPDTGKRAFYTFDKKSYRVQLIDEDTGQVVYSHASTGGIFGSIEEHTINDAEGTIEGVHQVNAWGAPEVIIHLMNMIGEGMMAAIEEPGPLKDALDKFKAAHGL